MDTDESHNLIPYQIDNVKTFLKVALRLSMAVDGSRSSKLRAALVSLSAYGTKEYSDNIRKFLESPESATPLIIESSAGHGNHTKIVHFVSSTYEQIGLETLIEANALIRSVQQKLL